MSNPRFTEEQVALILRRAAEVEAGAPLMSLEEIQAIARDVEIDPEIVARVAAELPREERAPSNGRSVALDFPRTLSQEEMGALLDVVRTTIRAPGSSRDSAGGLEWQSARDSEAEVVRMSITPVPGGTRIRVSYEGGVLAGLSTIAVAGPALIGILLSVKSGTAVGGAIAAVLGVSAAIATRWIPARLRRRGEGIVARTIAALQREAVHLALNTPRAAATLPPAEKEKGQTEV